jgi:hypothetical protein
MSVLDALNWPVLKCPQLAGFEVSPEGTTQLQPATKPPIKSWIYMSGESPARTLPVVSPERWMLGNIDPAWSPSGE